jgi:hypothetical protein
VVKGMPIRDKLKISCGPNTAWEEIPLIDNKLLILAIEKVP